jgi:hypothetical protein
VLSAHRLKSVALPGPEAGGAASLLGVQQTAVHEGTLFVTAATLSPQPMNSARRSRESLTVMVPAAGHMHSGTVNPALLPLLLLAEVLGANQLHTHSPHRSRRSWPHARASGHARQVPALSQVLLRGCCCQQMLF